MLQKRREDKAGDISRAAGHFKSNVSDGRLHQDDLEFKAMMLRFIQ